MKFLAKSLAVASTALILAACGDDDSTAVSSGAAGTESSTGNGSPASPDTGASGVGTDSSAVATNSAVDVASATPELSILVEAVVAAGLADTLANAGPFTIFAPTNDAFVALLGELGVSKDELLANQELLKTVLTYHVVGGTIKAADVPLGKAIVPLAGSLFKVESDGNSLTVTDGRGRQGRIIATDVMADNAVIHVIDKVILPANQSIIATAQASNDFSILVEAVVAADLVDTLSGTGPFTVFAPTNEAFASLLAELSVSKEALLADKDLLTQVLTYHVVAGQILKADIQVGQPVSTVLGESFTVDEAFAISDQRARMASIVAADVFTTNGVIHAIDRVILPAAMMAPVPVAQAGSTIVDIAAADTNFSILVEAVVAAGLADTLSGNGPFTVFAPTNDAFVALLSELGLSKEALLGDKELLTAVLLYHVLDFKVLAADVPLNSHIRSIGGSELSVNNDFMIIDARKRQAQITVTDIEAENGVIHVIDRVILPQ